MRCPHCSKQITLTTYQVECNECGELRWPYLPERPRTYTCVRCLSVPPEQRAAKREQAQRAAQTRKARQKSPGDATEAP